MALVHGKNAVVKIDNAAGTLVDLTTYITSIDMPESREASEVTAFGSQAKQRFVGLRDSSVKVEFNYDSVVYSHLAALVAKEDTTTTVEFSPAGTSTGMPKMSVECWLTELSIKASPGDVLTISASFDTTGVVTRSTN